MRRLLTAIGIAVAASLGVSSPVSAAQVMHVQAGQQWTVEIEISSGQYGIACAIETIGPNNTFTADFPLEGTYTGGAATLTEHFTDTLTGNSFKFHGSWSPSLMQYTGEYHVRHQGAISPGVYPGQIVYGAMSPVDGTTC